MKQYLPSKNFIGVVTPLLIGFGIAGYVLYTNAATTLSQETGSNLLALQASAAIEKSLIEKDSDEDGLEDWEELLWGTQVQTADSDNDGTLDGEEVAQGRDPNTPGPDDLLSERNSLTNTGDFAVATSASSTNTEIFAKNMFGSYLMLKQRGGFDDPETKQDFVQDMVTNAMTSYRIEPLTDENLIVIENPTRADHEQYHVKMQEFVRLFTAISDHEFVTIRDAVAAHDDAKLQGVRSNVSVYEDAITSLEEMPVPKEAILGHFNFMNGLHEYTTIVQQLSQLQDDPLTATMALRVYPTTEEKLEYGLQTLKTYFDNHELYIII